MKPTLPAGFRLVVLGVAGVVGAAWPAAADAEVLFQNTGNKQGWGRVFTQKAGTIDEVTSPVYKGATSVKTTQTYQTSDRKNYHSEIIKEKAHLAGQDLYYGHAVYLPPDWVFHNQNVTFQQWAPEQPEAPWILMYLQGDRVRLGGRGANGDKDAGSVAGLKGTWIRFVTRIHMANDGAFEVWINGQKSFSQKGNFRAHGPSMRWSNGIYCTRWDTETPSGPRVLSLWHDNMRIATTYAEADPATWGDGDPGPTGTPGDGGVGDAGTVTDAGGVPSADAGTGGAGGGGGSGGASGAGGSGSGGGTGVGAPTGAGGAAAGGSSATGGSSASGSGSGGSMPVKPPPPPVDDPSPGQASGGCSIDARESRPGLAALIVVLAGLALLRRRRRAR